MKTLFIKKDNSTKEILGEQVLTKEVSKFTRIDLHWAERIVCEGNQVAYEVKKRGRMPKYGKGDVISGKVFEII